MPTAQAAPPGTQWRASRPQPAVALIKSKNIARTAGVTMPCWRSVVTRWNRLCWVAPSRLARAARCHPAGVAVYHSRRHALTLVRPSPRRSPGRSRCHVVSRGRHPPATSMVAFDRGRATRHPGSPCLAVARRCAVAVRVALSAARRATERAALRAKLVEGPRMPQECTVCAGAERRGRMERLAHLPLVRRRRDLGHTPLARRRASDHRVDR